MKPVLGIWMYALLLVGAMQFGNDTSVIVATGIGQGVILTTFIIERWFAWKRENRQRQWDLEDRTNSRRRLNQHVEEVKQDIAETKEVLQDGLQSKVNAMLARFDALEEKISNGGNSSQPPRQ